MLLRRGALLFVLLLFSPFVFAVKRKTKAVYCSRAADGAWKLQQFEPLINPRAGTVFTELPFAGAMLEEARLRRFHPDREVVFDYKFDSAGRLTSLFGSIEL
jgi:hypothetical protein